MQIIPVLDLMNSVVVRGVGGRRDEYRPIESTLTQSAAPLDVADALRQHFGLTALYVADLDAILQSEPNLAIYEQLAAAGFDLMVDAGLRSLLDAETVLTAGARRVIAGTESWPLLSSLESLCRRIGPERLIVSLDLQQGRMIRSFPDLLCEEPVEVGAALIEAGVRQLIVLDLASVGTGGGVPTLELCQALRDFCPEVTLITGGGIRSVADLKQLEHSGIDGALVASALHDGRVTPAGLSGGLCE